MIDKREKMDKQRLNRKLRKGIVFGESLKKAQIHSWKGQTLKTMAEKPDTKFQVEVQLQQIKKKLKAGETILNEDYIRSLGFTT